MHRLYIYILCIYIYSLCVYMYRPFGGLPYSSQMQNHRWPQRNMFYSWVWHEGTNFTCKHTRPNWQHCSTQLTTDYLMDIAD